MEALAIKGSNEYFGLREGKVIKLIATQKMYRQTVAYNRDLTKQDIEDAKLQQQVLKYSRDVEQLTNMLDDVRLSDLTDEEKFNRMDDLQKALDSKVNPMADGEYLLRDVDRYIDMLDLSVDYLHEVLDTQLTDKQIAIIDEANGTNTIKLARQVTQTILGLQDDKSEEKQEDNSEDEVGAEETLKD